MTLILFSLFIFFLIFIFYTYFGYPFLIWLLSKFFPPIKINDEIYTPSITLLIAAYNEEKVIQRKIEQSLNLDYPHELLQIIVAADGSDDMTVDIVRAFEDFGVELSFDPARGGKMAAINRAMLKARGEIVVFSDANNDYSPDVLYKIVQPYADSLVGAVTGSKRIYKDDSFLSNADGMYWKYEAFIKSSENRIGCCLGVSGEVFSIRKSLFTVPPKRIINDDFYMAMDIIKKGYNVIYSPLAKSFEKMSQNEKDEITRRTRIFAGQIQLLVEDFSKLPFSRPLILLMMLSHKFFRVLLPIAFVGVLVLNILILLFTNFSEVFFITSICLQILFYMLAVIGISQVFSGFIGRVLYIPAFLVSSNYSALLGIIRYFTGKQTVVWNKAKRS